jgi:DNA-binding CsgD family transcriptional regulator
MSVKSGQTFVSAQKIDTLIIGFKSRMKIRSFLVRFTESSIMQKRSTQSEKILAFSDFLARQPKSYNEIAQFLVMNTFSEEKFRCIYIGELIETGVVCPLGGFGWSSEEYSSVFDVSIHKEFPLTDSIRSNTVVLCQNGSEYNEQYPAMEQFLYQGDWVSGVAIPVYPIGGMALYSSIKLELTEAMTVFYITIGSLLGLYASRLPSALVAVALSVKEKIDLPQVPMTDRQLVIAGLLERGFNNAQIGLEIGYSESLIRQETVAIYRKLQVTGRKAMQAIKTLNLEVENNTEI